MAPMTCSNAFINDCVENIQNTVLKEDVGREVEAAGYHFRIGAMNVQQFMTVLTAGLQWCALEETFGPVEHKRLTVEAQGPPLRVKVKDLIRKHRSPTKPPAA